MSFNQCKNEIEKSQSQLTKFNKDYESYKNNSAQQYQNINIQLTQCQKAQIDSQKKIVALEEANKSFNELAEQNKNMNETIQKHKNSIIVIENQLNDCK